MVILFNITPQSSLVDPVTFSKEGMDEGVQLNKNLLYVEFIIFS